MPGETINSGTHYMGNKIFTANDILHFNPYSHMLSTDYVLPTVKAQAARAQTTIPRPRALDVSMPSIQSYQANSPIHGPSIEDNASFPTYPQYHDPANTLNKSSGRDYVNQRPGANNRQAWASQPTFRFFRRNKYFAEDYNRNSKRGKMIGDTYYRPRSVEHQKRINQRIYNKMSMRTPKPKGIW